MTTLLQDIATALTASTANDGQTKITGNWDFQAKNLTNVGTLAATSVAATAVATNAGVTVGDTLTVTKGGVTVSAGGAAIIGNSTVAGTLTVTTGGAAITGNSTVTGTLTVTKGVALGDDVSVAGNAFVGGYVVVTGALAAANGTSSNQVVNYSQFPATLGSTGTTTLPNGLIMKWGTGSTVAGAGSVAYAAAFPSQTNNVQITINGGGGATSLNPVIVGAVDRFGFFVYGAAAQSLTFYWHAIGQ